MWSDASPSFSDVKPANYAVGLGEKVRTVYILDFGIARKITKEDNSIKTPRSNVAFKVGPCELVWLTQCA